MTEEQLRRLPAILFEVGKVLGSDQDVGATLSRISELACELLACDACSVMLLDGSRRELLARAAFGLRTEKVHKLSFAVGDGVAGWVAQRGEPARIDDVATDRRFVILDDAPKTPIVSMACVPMLARGQVVGVLTATSGLAAAFRQSDVELLSFLATTIALDMENLRLHKVAVTDQLTGAFNREFLAARLPAEMESSDGQEHALSVAMVDVDHFKTINDRFGHDVGDDVLCEVAAGPVVVGARLLPVRVSVGIAQYRGGESAPALVRRADGALYAAKGNGRDRVEVA